MSSSIRVFVVLVSAAILALGCDSGTSGGAAAATPAIEIVGSWTNNFAGDETITADKWTSAGGAAKIVALDNGKNLAYTQNAADAQYGPAKFNKTVWTEPKADSFYYCMIDFNKDSLALAKASTLVADDKDLEKSGCAGFGWTKMTKKK